MDSDRIPLRKQKDVLHGGTRAALSDRALNSPGQIPLILILSGQGDNGKTKLIETATRLLGSDLVYASRIQDLSNDKFATGNLLGKLLFLDDDVKAGVRLPDGELKKISEAKLITGQRKFGPTFNFIVRTVPVLLCNNPPSLADLSHGMRRRLMVIPFDRIFKVTGARFEHGLLTIELRREVPEALKPRRIEIAATSGQASVAQNNVTTLDQSKVA